MTVTVTERFESRTSSRGETPSVALLYNIEGTDDDQEALDALLADSPKTWGAGNNLLQRQQVQVEPLNVDENQQIGLWVGTVTYGRLQPLELDVYPSAGSFEIGTATKHITHSLETVGLYGEQADLGGGINYEPENRTFQGVNVAVPEYRFTETHLFDATDVDNAFRKKLTDHVGTVNFDLFRGFISGEVLMEGVSGSQRARGNDMKGEWELNFRFAVRRNRENFQIGEVFVTQHLGWDHLWVKYTLDFDANIKRLVSKPVSVYVERVYEYTNFSNLGLVDPDTL